MEGFVSAYTDDPIRVPSLEIRGEGMINGDLEFNVGELEVALDGMCKMTLVGTAKSSDLQLDGMGKIDARGLQTDKLHKSTDGLASIKSSN